MVKQTEVHPHHEVPLDNPVDDAHKGDKLLIHATTVPNLQKIPGSEKSQSQNVTHGMIHLYNIL